MYPIIMNKSLLYLSLFTLCLTAFANLHSANAQELDTSEACNIPRDVEPTKATDERWVYCDIHSRQFAYREKQIDYRNQLKARQEGYRNSTKTAEDNYKQALKDHYATLNN